MKIILTCCILFSAITMHAQQSIEGFWNTGQDNTVVEVLQEDGKWAGKIHASDNAEVVIGKTILKDLKKQGSTWKGEIFIAKRQRWADVQLTPQASQLDVLVSAGFSKKEVQCLKAK